MLAPYLERDMGAYFRHQIGAYEVPLWLVPEFLERHRGSLSPDTVRMMEHWTPALAETAADHGVLPRVIACGSERGPLTVIGLCTASGAECILLCGTAERERQSLIALANVLRGFGRIVTYGGDLDDLRLLADAYRRHGMTAPFAWERHLDLMQFACLLLQEGRIPDCRLSTLETYYTIRRETLLSPLDLPDLWRQARRGSREHAQAIADLTAADLRVLTALAKPLIRQETSPDPKVTETLRLRSRAEQYLRPERTAREIAMEMALLRLDLVRAAGHGTVIRTDYGILQVDGLEDEEPAAREPDTGERRRPA